MYVRLGPMLGSLVNACFGRDLARALLLLPAPPVFWTLLVLLLESVDALAWACRPADAKGVVVSRVAPSEFRRSFVGIPALLGNGKDVVRLMGSLLLYAPSEVLGSAVDALGYPLLCLR